MLENARHSQMVSLSVKIYRNLVRAYPAGFRKEYSDAMVQVFRDCCRQAYLKGGGNALLMLWARTAMDYIKTLIDEYAKGGTNMTREKFIKLSG